MTHTLTLNPTSNVFSPPHDVAVSNEAAKLRSYRADFILKPVQETISLDSRDAQSKLRNVFLEATHDNWDGYGARAVNPVTLRNAMRFINALPIGYPQPDVSTEPDGEIAFDWRTGPYKSLSISVGPKDILTFAALINRSELHGVEVFIDEIPSRLKALIKEINEQE